MTKKVPLTFLTSCGILLVLICYSMGESKVHVGDVSACGNNFTKSNGMISNSTLPKSYVCNFYLRPKNKTDGIYLFLEVLQLDVKDSVVIMDSSNKTLFGPFGPQIDSILLVTQEKTLTIQVNTSAEKKVRHFKAAYQAQACTFSVTEDVIVTQPVYLKNITESIPCKYVYNRDQARDALYTFIFDSFNLSKAELKVDGISGTATTFTGSTLPRDLLQEKKDHDVTFEMSFDPTVPSDTFRLHKLDVNPECSNYVDASGKEVLKSPSTTGINDPVECRWFIENKNTGGALGLNFQVLDFVNAFDVAVISDGPHMQATPFLQVTSLNTNATLVKDIRTSGQYMMVSFKPVSFYSNFSAEVFVSSQGKYMEGNGTFKATPNSDKETMFLLQVNDDENVLLTFKESSLPEPIVLRIYEDFSSKGKEIAALTGNVWYPILSSTSKMMVRATDFSKGNFEAEFKGTAAGCMHMSTGTSGSYILSGNCNSSCAWIIPPISSEDDLLLDLQYISLDESDKVEIIRLDSNKTVIANISAGTTHVPQFSLAASVGAYVNVTRGKCNKPNDIILVGHSNYLPTCSRNMTLSTYGKVQLTSPNYPDTYPLLVDCKIGVKRSLDNLLLHLAFDHLQLAPNHCILISQITKNGTASPQITGSTMPDDFVFTGDVIVQFKSVSCDTTKVGTEYVSSQGFVLNVTSTDCGGSISDKAKGNLTIPANKTTCIWKIVVPDPPKPNANDIVFSIKEGDKSGNYKLKVYDGGSVRDGPANVTAKVTESRSRTDSLIFIYERVDASKASAPISIDYKAETCNKTWQCESNHICIHPEWRCNGKNDCGDGTDEKNCGSVPVPEDTKTAGVSSTTYGVSIVCFFLLGMVLAILVPKGIERYRNSSYRPFRDVSVIE